MIIYGFTLVFLGPIFIEPAAQPLTSGALPVQDDKPGLPPLFGIINTVLMALVYLGVFAYLQAVVTNLIWNNTRLAGHGFRSTLKTGKMLWLYLSNTLAIVFSFGLLIPWARIRMTRYRLANIRLLAHGELGDFVAGEQQAIAATGEELSEIFDVDLGL
jgi:uncharacterized membrane protein YjgN (DUF898 family)